MAKSLGPVALQFGDEVLVKVRTNTTIQDLLEQVDKAYKDGRFEDVEGSAVTRHLLSRHVDPYTCQASCLHLWLLSACTYN